MRKFDTRWLVAFGGTYVFLVVVGQVNHHLSDTPLLGGTVNVFMVGLPVAFAALRLSLGQGLTTTVATALLAEAGLPAAEGAILVPAAACLCITHALRVNFNRLNPSSAIAAALAINFVLMAALTVAFLPFEWAGAWPRMLADLALSQAAVAALAGWFFSGQIALLRLFGFNLETELREAP